MPCLNCIGDVPGGRGSGLGRTAQVVEHEDQFGEPPLANLLRFVPNLDQLRERDRPSIPRPSQPTQQAIENVEPTKAA
jgi:hypothetical protein